MTATKELWQDENYRAKQKEARKEYYESQRLKDQIRDNPLMGGEGELNGFYGKEHDDETKERMSESHKKTWEYSSPEMKAKRMSGIDKSVCIIDTKTGIEYQSINIAAEAIGINPSTLGKMIRNKIKNTTTMIRK